MVKYLLVLIVFSLFLIPFRSASAQMGMMDLLDDREIQEDKEAHRENLDQVLADILVSQDVETINKIDCNNIQNSHLERLGEASMSLMHPDPDVHQRMDEMMGGEDSETLRAAHINMGNRFLGCTTQIKGRGWNGFMGMMSMGGVGTWGGMNTGLFGFHWLFGLTTWVLGNVLLIVLIRYFWRKGGEKK